MAKQKIWFTFEIYNNVDCKWEVVAKIKSTGLKSRTFEMLANIYGRENVRVK